ncbi:hypothetical protein [Cellulomonas endophytica]|uniref:hypothetical protein n=1 Tax=Cellulomonas endophytica TaxID=2494735 RepID=UPI0010115287|nr:hypothetical protein [Cellulomonas endophytica]
MTSSTRTDPTTDGPADAPDDRPTHAVVGGPTGVVVPAALLSNFFEHMAGATSGGVAAEVVMNPTFARKAFLREGQLEPLLANGAVVDEAAATGSDAPFERWWPPEGVSGWGMALFDDETAAGIPLPWARVGAGRVLASVGRIGHAVRLFGGSREAGVTDLAAGPSGVRQVVLVPAHRERRLRLAVVARATRETGGEVEVQLLRRHTTAAGPRGEVLAVARLPLASRRWTDLEATLETAEGAVARREPLDLVVRWLAGTDVDLGLDRVSLLPVDAVDGIDPDVVAIARGHVPQLRWPGGNFVSYHHWRHGIGPVELRPALEVQAWGGLEHHLIGTHEYVSLCRQIGAAPHITVNAGTGTAEEAAAWVEYCNGDASTPMGALRARNGHPEPFGVTLWEVGNEPWGEFQGGNFGSEENARRFVEFAHAMRAASPIPLRLLAQGNWFDLLDVDHPRHHDVSADGFWHAELARQAADEVDLVSVHWVAIAGDFPEDPASDETVDRALMGLLVSAERRFLPALAEVFDRSERRPDLPPVEIAMTEWTPVGAPSGRPADRIMPDNVGGAAWAAACLNTLARCSDRVTIASPNGFMHGNSYKKGAGVVYADPGIDVMGLYETFVGGTVLRVDLDGPTYDVPQPMDVALAESDIPFVDVLAVRRADGGLSLSLVNRDGAAPRTVVVRLPEGAGATFRTVDLGDHPVDRRAHPAAPDRFARVEGALTATDGALAVELRPLGFLLLHGAAPAA